MTILWFILGLVLLIAGAEVLVKGSSRLASSFGVSPLIIGLTVVAFGTSSPELAVSIKSALSGQSGIAVGNVVGSNIFNVLFILGISALIIPLQVSKQLIRLDVPLMIFLSAFLLILSLDTAYSRIDGLLLTFGLMIYIVFLFYQNRKDNGLTQSDSTADIENSTTGNRSVNVVLVIVGLVLLVFGSRWLVDSAVSFAEYLGISELIIGLTIIAAGTSLPEVVTSIIAAVRGERDIAVGNIVGSNIFNIMGVLGISSIVAPTGLDISSSVIRFDIPIMIVVAFACLPIFFTGGVISRWEGGLLLMYYMAYTLYIILAASHYAALSTFSNIMLYFAIPLTLITIIIIAIREFSDNKRDH